MIRKEIQDISVNGWNTGHHLLQYLEPIVKPHVARLRKQYVCGKDELRGGRFRSDDRVFLRIVSAFYAHRFEPADLSQEEIDCLINKALKECARADHWYMYEKDWL